MLKNKLKHTLLIITIWIISLRAYKLYSLSSITQDESTLYNLIKYQSWFDLFFRSNQSINDASNPPLYYFLMKTWLNLFDFELSLRIPSLVFSLASIFISYKIVILMKDRVNNYKLVTLYLFFNTINLLTFLGVLARTYSLGITFTLAATYFTLLAAKSQSPSRKLRFLLSFSLAGAVFSNYSSVWPLLSFFIYFLFDYKSYRKLISSYLYSLLILSPWLIIFFKSIKNVIRGKASEIEALTNHHSFLSASTNFFDLLSYSPDHQTFLNSILICLIIVSLSVFFLFKRHFSNEEFRLITISISLPFSIVAIFSIFFAPVYDLKNLYYPYFMLLYLWISLIFKIKIQLVRRCLITLLIGLLLRSNVLFLSSYTNEFHSDENLYLNFLNYAIQNSSSRPVQINLGGSELEPFTLYTGWYYKNIITLNILSDNKYEIDTPSYIIFHDFNFAPSNIPKTCIQLEFSTFPMEGSNIFQCKN